MMNQPTVFVVDDDDDVRESLRWLLESVGLRVETYGSAHAFLSSYRPEWPGCLVLDVRMPETSGLQLQETLNARQCRIPIILVTGHGDVPMAVRAMQAGAMDFIEKPFNDQVLVERIQQCLAQDLAERQSLAESAAVNRRLLSLTPRENDVLERVIAGKANKVIAAELDISTKTVEVHRANLMQKMRADSLASLLRMVIGRPPQGKP